MKGYTLDLGDRHNPLGDHALHLVEPKQWPGERETVVGELRHYTPRAVAAAELTGTACLSKRSAIASISLRSTTGRFVFGKATSEATATMCGSSGCMTRLAVGGAVDFQFGKGVALEAFDHYKIDRRHFCDQRTQVPFRLLAQFMQDGPALG